MKQGVCARWVHPICVMFTNELTVDNDMRACNLDKLDPERQDLVCMVCKDKTGSSVQCSEPGCLVASHAYCAFKSDFQMTLHESTCTNIEGFALLQCKIYCFLHFNRYANDNTLISCRDRHYLEHLERLRVNQKNNDKKAQQMVTECTESSPVSQIFAEVWDAYILCSYNQLQIHSLFKFIFKLIICV